MKTKFLPVLTTLLIFFNQARAQTPDPLRKDLVRAGDALMGKTMSADDFVLRAREMKTQRPFNEEERSYLADVSEKLPADLRQAVCPTMTEGLCLPTDGSLTAETLADAERDLAWDHDLPKPIENTEYSKPLLWIVAAGLVFLAGSAALKGKELQIRSR